MSNQGRDRTFDALFAKVHNADKAAVQLLAYSLDRLLAFLMLAFEETLKITCDISVMVKGDVQRKSFSAGFAQDQCVNWAVLLEMNLRVASDN